jgi:hypothetical protein
MVEKGRERHLGHRNTYGTLFISVDRLKQTQLYKRKLMSVVSSGETLLNGFMDCQGICGR